MDELEYMKIYEGLFFGRKKKSIPVVYIGSYDKRRFENNLAIVFWKKNLWEKDIDGKEIPEKEVCLLRFGRYNLNGNKLSIRGNTYDLVLRDSEREYLVNLLEKKLTKNL